MISFACSSCSRVISVDEKYSGKRGKCPKCGSIVIVPERSTVIKFHCESCGHKIKVPGKYGGKKGKCPQCHETVVIPSIDKDRAIVGEMVRITCQMCGQSIEIPEHVSDEFIECPSCGSYIETQSNGALSVSAEPDDSLPPTEENNPYQEAPYESEESVGIDRRLIIIISAAAAVLVVGLVILVAVLRLSRPESQLQQQRQVVDTAGSQTETTLEEAKGFAEQYISLLENGEVEEAFKYHSPELAKDVYRFSFEKLSEQIGSNKIIEMNCTRTQLQPHPEGDLISLWYNLNYEEGIQIVNINLLPSEQNFKVERITAKDDHGNSLTIGLSDSATPSRSSRTITRRRANPSTGKIFFAIIIGFTFGTFFSACCLWIGMKITKVDGTFGVMLGIAAISGLLRIMPIFIGLMPCVGWLLGLIVMLLLLCKWTDAELWPDAIGIVVISALVGIGAQFLLGFVISMA